MNAFSPVRGEGHRNDGPNRRYSPEVKAEAVRRVREGRQSVAQVSRELSIKAGSLYLWLRKAEVLGQEPFLLMRGYP